MSGRGSHSPSDKSVSHKIDLKTTSDKAENGQNAALAFKN